MRPLFLRACVVVVLAALALAPAALADSTTTQQVIDRVRNEFNAGRRHVATAVLDSLLRAARSRGSARDELAALVIRARMLVYGGDPVEGEAESRAAIRLATALSDSASLRAATRSHAFALGALGRGEESAAEWRRLVELAVAGRDFEHEAWGRLGIGYEHERAGRDDPARREYEAAGRLFQQGGNPLGECWAFTNLGHLQRRLGDFRAARRAYQRVAEVSRAGRVPEYQMHAANNLGTLEYYVGDPGRALASFSEARRLGEAASNPPDVLIAISNLALMLDLLGRHDEALALTDTGLAVARARQLRSQESDLLVRRGEILQNQGRLHRSASELRLALRLADASPPKNQMEAVLGLATTLGRLDSAEAGVRLVEEAERRLRSRLEASDRADVAYWLGSWDLERGDAAGALLRLRAAERLAMAGGAPRQAIAALALEARACRRLERFDEAETLLARATAFWEAERELAVQPEWRERFAVHARDLHIERARLCLADERRGDRFERACLAFDAVQPFRARTLAERMRGPERRGAPALEIATARAVQASLESGEMFLDAVSADDGTILFALTPDHVSAEEVAIPADSLRDRLRLFHRLASIPSDDAAAVVVTEAAIGRVLLRPFADELRRAARVIFSPDGELCRLPLGALRLSDFEEPLLARTEVTTVPSASVFLTHRRARAERVGPVTDHAQDVVMAWAGPGPGGGPMPGARDEVRWLRGRFEHVELRRGGERPLDELGRGTASVLHFAGHTEADDRHPWRSGLLIGDPIDDPYLRAVDVASARLPIRLVVLSSCTTAGGTVLTGEGVLGLGAAFLAAGTTTVVASLWPVADRATSRLMRVFYRELARGATAAAALRSAQLELRRQAGSSHPATWAAFVLIGEPDTRVALRPRWPVGVFLAALLGVVGLGLLAAGPRVMRRRVTASPAPAQKG